MGEKFQDGAADRLLDRIEKDETGDLKRLVGSLMEASKKLSKAGVPLDELAATVTMFWFVGQNPEMEALVDAFKGLEAPDEKFYN